MRREQPAVLDVVRSSALVALAAVYLLGPRSSGADDPGAVFERHRGDLLEDGVRPVDGFVFSTVRQTTRPNAGVAGDSDPEGKVALRAVRRVLEWRIGSLLGLEAAGAGLRAAAIAAGVGCLDGGYDFSGLLTVHSQESEGTRVVVCAVPESKVDAIRTDLGQLSSCLRDRIASGHATVLDALVLGELAAMESSPLGSTVHGGDERELRASLVRLLGPGFTLAKAGGWVDDEGRLLPGTLIGWTRPAAEAVRRAGSTEAALLPLSDAALESLSTDDLIELLTTRLHDPSVRQALVARLETSGFRRCAEEFGSSSVQARAFRDRPGGGLSREVKAKVASSPLVVAMLLADGETGVRWGEPPSCMAEAVRSFDQATPDSVEAAIVLLLDGMGAVPSVDAMSLLSAALLARGEP